MMSALTALQLVPADAGTSATRSHQVKRLHVVKHMRVLVQVVRFLIVLHVGRWLSDLTHLLEPLVAPQLVYKPICQPAMTSRGTRAVVQASCKCPHRAHNMWPVPPSRVAPRSLGPLVSLNNAAVTQKRSDKP